MVRPLTRDEYLGTFAEPMRLLAAVEPYQSARIGEYVAECLREAEPPVTREQLQVHHIYRTGDQRYYHVLLYYGRHNRYLVVIVDGEREAVYGHYWLDLNAEYGLDVVGRPLGKVDQARDGRRTRR